MLLMEETNRLTEEVTITIDEYIDLIDSANKWETIRAAIWDNAVCFTSAITMEPGLSLEGHKILDAMKVIDRQKYKEALNGRTYKD